jgi:ABC-type sugar transport system ATPase subunit
MNNSILKMENIYKHFDGRVALEYAGMELLRGEVLGLVGDNGAGKSTMLKILSGVLQKDGGNINIRGRDEHIRSPKKARSLGIEMVYQDLALCGSLNAWENMYLGRYITGLNNRKILPFLNKKMMYNNTAELLADLDINLTGLDRPVRELSGGERQAIAICRCLLFEPEIILLDEPTASMAVSEQEKILGLILKLKRRGHSLVMVTHNLQELFKVADRAMVLKGGRNVWAGLLSGIEPNDLAQMMFTGRE